MRAYAATIAIVGWFAVMAQLVLILQNSTSGVFITAVRFVSYFTILTNILVACCFTSLGFFPDSKWGRFFGRASVIAAVTVYITIVGIVYNVALRPIWDPQGWQKLVDELLHSVIPVMTILYFFVFAPREKIRWSLALSWLIYPFVYSLYIIMRGAIGGEYPYPFIDVTVLGYPMALVNCLVVMIAFLVVSFVFIGVSRYRSKPV